MLSFGKVNKGGHAQQNVFVCVCLSFERVHVSVRFYVGPRLFLLPAYTFHLSKSIWGLKSAVFHSVVSISLWVHVFMCVSKCMCLSLYVNLCVCVCVCVCARAHACVFSMLKAITIESVGGSVSKHSNLMKKVKQCHFNLHPVHHVVKILVQLEPKLRKSTENPENREFPVATE